MTFPNDPTAAPKRYTLEQILLLLAEKDEDAKQLQPRYESMKLFLEKEYYPWIQATCPFFTDHGSGHINSVIQAASRLLERHLDPTGEKGLNAVEIFLVLAAILWHDVGNARGRTGHAARIDKMTAEIRRLGFPDPALHRLVVQIAQAHAGADGLAITRPEADCVVCRTVTVFPRPLAAVVRFADEVSEDRSRISLALLPDVPAVNQIFWQHANCITASRPEPSRERVVLTVEVPDAVAAERYLCPGELLSRADSEAKISLIEYLVLRLEKMNNERAYCEPEFRRYASIREIVVRLSVIADTRPLRGYEEEFVLGGNGLAAQSYPAIDVYDRFFRQYPNWRPNAISAARTSP